MKGRWERRLGAEERAHRQDAKVLLRFAHWIRPYRGPLSVSLVLLFVAGLLGCDFLSIVV